MNLESFSGQETGPEFGAGTNAGCAPHSPSLKPQCCTWYTVSGIDKGLVPTGGMLRSEGDAGKTGRGPYTSPKEDHDSGKAVLQSQCRRPDNEIKVLMASLFLELASMRGTLKCRTSYPRFILPCNNLLVKGQKEKQMEKYVLYSLFALLDSIPLIAGLKRGSFGRKG